MTPAFSAIPTVESRRGWPVILLAGIVAGVFDIAYVIGWLAFRGVGATRILQGIAAGAVGREAAAQGGFGMAALGLALHFLIALTAAAVFYAASRRLRALVERPWISGMVYGVVVWLFMNLAVLPLSATPPKSFPPAQWRPVLIAHVVCVGLPIAWVVRRFGR